MRAADDAILAALAVTNMTVHRSFVTVTLADNKVTYPLPFLVYYSSLGDEGTTQLAGQTTRISKFWQVTYVGGTQEQAMWAGEKQRAALQGKRLTVNGRPTGLCTLEESQRIRRDDDAIRPDGSPLFYGVDQYAVNLRKLITA